MNGILLVDKPLEWTSHDVVNFIRRRFRIKKVGHAGTLDPIATGLLVLFLGQSTKSIKDYENDDKEYLAVMGLGCKTFSDDGTGEVITHSIPAYIPESRIREVFSSFVGTIEQVPPHVSAIKVNGKRSYKMALAGEIAELQPRTRTIYSLEILHYNFPYIIFSMACSRGTYVRKLCSDIGVKLNCSGYMSNLIRVRSGKFTLSDAVSIASLKSINRDDFSNFVINQPDALALRCDKKTELRRYAR
ncbi:MAG: tRNA pseudouridine(55) synthase TruB [Candidatus Auribacterota bacterium]